MPLLLRKHQTHLKDPCPVFDGGKWHIFGTTYAENCWHVLHLISDFYTHDWELAPIALEGIVSPNACAPGVIYDGCFHMLLQTEYFRTGGDILYLTSSNGTDFALQGPVLRGSTDGIYDPHPAVIKNQKYLTYTRFPPGDKVQGDIYLATADSWHGPWEDLGKIVDHADVCYHNSKNSPDYEWGLEGAQLLDLNDRILLQGVCFLSTGERGTRQRVFFAVADSALGPYTPLYLLEPSHGSEVGHATGFLKNNMVVLFYQEYYNHYWEYGIQEFDQLIFCDAA